MLKNKVQPAVRVILFARVSTKPQAAEDRYSIAAQLTEMREFCGQKGWKIVGEIVEVVSGKASIRIKLKELLALVRAGAVDVVLVHELSRLSRSVYQTLHIFEVFGENNVGFASVKDPDFDFTDPSRRFFLIIMAAINEYYLNLLRLHTSKAKQQRAREGRHNASVMPFGYAGGGGPRQPPVIVPAEADLIRQAFEDYATGQYTDLEIAERINISGITTHRCRRRFSKDCIADLLTNPFYMGKLPYRRRCRAARKIYDGLHTPIVSGDLFDRCRKVRETRRVGSRAMQKPWRAYLLSRLASCDICGRKLRCQPGYSTNYYREASFQRGYVDCPHQRLGVRVEAVDQQMDMLIQALTIPTQLSLSELPAGDEVALARHLAARREKLEAEQRRLREMRLHGDYDNALDEYFAELARLRRELEQLPAADPQAEQRQALETLRELQAEWPAALLARRRDLLRRVLRDVGVDVVTGRVTSISPLPPYVPIFQQIRQFAERQPGVFVPLWSPEQALHLPNTTILPTMTDTPRAGVVLPFIITDPLTLPTDSRIAPALSHALMLCRKHQLGPKSLIQVCEGQVSALPADLRRWPGATAKVVDLQAVLNRPPESVDVLSTRCLFSSRDALKDGGGMVEDELRMLGATVAPNGVWHFMEALPAEQPVHWLFTFFPELWAVAVMQGLPLHHLCKLMQQIGFVCEVKRHRFYQPVTLAAALAMAEARPGLLRRLDDQTYQQGLARLSQAVAAQGAEYPAGSETTVVEIWAQKVVKQAKAREG